MEWAKTTCGAHPQSLPVHMTCSETNHHSHGIRMWFSYKPYVFWVSEYWLPWRFLRGHNVMDFDTAAMVRVFGWASVSSGAVHTSCLKSLNNIEQYASHATDRFSPVWRIERFKNTVLNRDSEWNDSKPDPRTVLQGRTIQNICCESFSSMYWGKSVLGRLKSVLERITNVQKTS